MNLNSCNERHCYQFSKAFQLNLRVQLHREPSLTILRMMLTLLSLYNRGATNRMAVRL